MRTRTYEELLINRITKAFESMDNVNAEFFDEIIEELEMLFKLKPDMYEMLMEWKKYHNSRFQENIDLAKKKVSQLEDEIAQEITIKYYQTKIEWSYRKDMLETMINILNEYKLIPFTNPEYAEIESIESAPPESQPEPPQEPEEIPPEPPIPPPIQRPQKVEIRSQSTPTNILLNQKPPQKISYEEQKIQEEANRLAREEEEIKKLTQQPQPKTPPQKPSLKKGFGLIKRM